MNTEAYAVTFIDIATGQASPVSIFSEPSPTCSLKMLPVVIEKASGATYGEARDTLIDWLGHHPYTNVFHRDPSGLDKWFWFGDPEGIPREIRLARAEDWARKEGFERNEEGGWDNDCWDLVAWNYPSDKTKWWYHAPGEDTAPSAVVYNSSDDALIAAYDEVHDPS